MKQSSDGSTEVNAGVKVGEHSGTLSGTVGVSSERSENSASIRLGTFQEVEVNTHLFGKITPRAKQSAQFTPRGTTERPQGIIMDKYSKKILENLPPGERFITDESIRLLSDEYFGHL